ncbi:tumor necrosis factor alpha-induced protein 2a [Chanos chanos]|uniref:Tumor necrosis factor alpha-induced protein 2a n=1 Tax=Chanos chanos TaxID=29144 RepID=A0A6J2V8Z1_CHACN|nr:tumor necrosis factor alpha-induced protein 2-like [Chanos chanos]
MKVHNYIPNPFSTKRTTGQPAPLSDQSLCKHETMKDGSETPGASCSTCIRTMVETAQNVGTESDKTKKKNKIKVRQFLRLGQSSNHKSNAQAIIIESPLKEEVFDFKENLERNRLAEAGQQLIAQEEALFKLGEITEEDEDRLQKDYEALLVKVWMAVHAAFSEDNRETLKSAVRVILQEEERDKYWEGAEIERPVWRPKHCRQNHDNLVQKLVEARMKHAEEEENGADKLSTSIKREVCRMGKRVQRDLLKVVRDIQSCYPQETDICDMYIQLYHQAFSQHLTTLARSSLETEDSVYILCWVNDYYPKDVLQHKELGIHMDRLSLGPLLREEDLKVLEEQYVSHKESRLKTWLSNVLRKEEESWKATEEPELINEYYISLLAMDAIHIIDSALKETRAILGEESKPQWIWTQLDGFLKSYKGSMEELIKGKSEKTPAILKANLVSIEQLRDYLGSRESGLPEGTKVSCLSTVTELTNCAQTALTAPIHAELKPKYCVLWTQAWFSGGQEVMGETVGILEEKIHGLRDMKPSCHEELLSRLHEEVLVEYVRRLLKRKLKLRDKVQQEAAATHMCEDNTRLNRLFLKEGSKEGWQSKIIPRLAEVLRLEDSGIIQLEIATIARDYPDLSEKHIDALLQLKANLSSSKIRRIKESLVENRGSVNAEPAPPFFSKVPVKRNIL